MEPSSSRNTTFSIIDPCGHVLLRLKCDSRSSAEKWLSALEDAGLRVAPSAAAPTEEAESHAVAAADHAKQQLHLSAAAVAAAAAAAQGNVAGDVTTTSRMESEPGTPKTQQQQERWEAYSTDSELPEMPGGVRRSGRPPAYRRQPEPGQAVGMPSYAGEAARAATSGRSSSSKDVIGYSREGGGQRGSPVRQQSKREAKGAEPGRSGGAAGAQRSPMVGSTPVHVHSRYSYLSSDGVWTAKHDGLLNLAMVILIVTNSRWGAKGSRSELSLSCQQQLDQCCGWWPQSGLCSNNCLQDLQSGLPMLGKGHIWLLSWMSGICFHRGIAMANPHVLSAHGELCAISAFSSYH